MPLEFTGKSKKGFWGSVASGAIAAGILGFLGIRAVKSRSERKRLESLVEEWEETDEYNSPRVVLLYYEKGEEGKRARELLWERGYGVIWVNQKDDAQSALKSLDSISAVVHEARLPNLAPNNLKVTDNIYLPVMKISGNAARDAKAYEKLKDEIDERCLKAQGLLSRIVGYYDTEIAQRGFHRAPKDIESALTGLVAAKRFIMLRETYEAHRGGVIASLKTGAPINRRIHYATSEGVCFKIESRSDLEEIARDYELFGNREEGVLAKPCFYAVLDEQTAIVARSKFIGPTFAQVFSKLLLWEDAEFVHEAIRKTLSAAFEIAAEYHKYKRSEEEAITDEVMTRVMSHYKANIGPTYVRLRPLIENCGISEQEVVGLLDNEVLLRKEWYLKVLDLFPPNFKLILSKEEPTLDELIGFYSRDKGKGGKRNVIDEAEIKDSIGFYDQGYAPWHLVDNFVRAGISAYGLPAKSGAWIDYAQDLFMKDLLAMEGVRGISMYDTKDTVVSEIFSYLRKVASTVRVQGEVTPDHLAVNFFVIAAYKLFRLVDNAISAAIRNEQSFAEGEMYPAQYNAYRRQYAANVRAHGENLFYVALTGAHYFETDNGRDTFVKVFAGMRRSFITAGRTPDDIPAFSNPLAKGLMAYAVIGREIMNNAGKVHGMFDDARARCRYVAEFSKP